ncbi:hypothetical protein CHS0354_033571 [Potamilus streckersoni]|uniref:Death domain-containing protein n=1 Tax=Potamilus streckersoni TaxID=2493646 RepID=A0AAE0T126_9BIVA|nr:hypothetical protein CHS0354_033571 [Potamilus streckersoni]
MATEEKTIPSIVAHYKSINFLNVRETYKRDEDNPDSVLVDYQDKWYKTCSLAEAKNALKILKDKVCVKGLPSRGSPGCYLATRAFTIILNIFRKWADDSDAVRAETNDCLLDLWSGLIIIGPGSTHLEIHEAMMNSDFREYFKKLKGDKLKRVVRTLKKEFHYDEKLSDDTDWSQIENLFGYYFSDEQYKEAQLEFLDLYFFYGKLIGELKSDLAVSNMESLCFKIARRYDMDNPLKEINDVAVLRKYLGVLREMILCEKFVIGSKGEAWDSYALRLLINSALESNLIEEILEELLAFFLEICKSKKCMNSENLMRIFRDPLFSDMKIEKLKNPEKTFVCCSKAMSEICKTKPVTSYSEPVIIKCHDILLNIPNQSSQRHGGHWIQLMIAYLKSGRKELIKIAREIYNDQSLLKAKVLEWKNYVKEVKEMIQIIGSFPLPDMESDDEGSVNDTVDTYANFLQDLLEHLRKSKLNSYVTPDLIQCVLHCLETYPVEKKEVLNRAVVSDFFDFKGHQELIGEVFRRMEKVLRNPDFPYDETYLYHSVLDMLQQPMKVYKTANQMPEDYQKLIVSIGLRCLEGNVDTLVSPEDANMGTLFLFIYQGVILPFIFLHDGSSPMSHLQPLMPHIFRLTREGEDMDMISMAGFGIMTWIGMKAPQLLKDCVPDIMYFFLEKEKSDMHSVLNGMYKSNSEAINKYIPEMIRKLPHVSSACAGLILSLLMAITQEQPQVLSKNDFKGLLDFYKTNSDSNQKSTFLYILKNVVENNPSKWIEFFPTFLDDKVFTPDTLSIRCCIIVYIAVQSESHSEQAIDYLLKHINNPNHALVNTILSYLLVLGRKHRAILAKRRPIIENLKTTTVNPDIKAECENLINIIEGRSVEGLSQKLQQQGMDISKLDTRVDAAEKKVVVIGDKAQKQEKDLIGVKKDVTKVGQRVDVVEKDLEETKEKVEEIDHKTLNNAPKWSRDVSHLMNPTTDKDWRLLASRLGYSADDIRGWATQNDPCMALLSEWYSTHKTSEATHGVLIALQEMNRLDVAVIVENAMKIAEDVVEDEEFDYPSPPPIFLSYHWGYQNEVKLLNQHLQKAGYECWIDIGQMGGGDKLFEKIDRGIRGAKVIICCVTNKYAQSPNCNREVNLSVNLGKPMIPLQMEKMEWPPKGSMGPIFSEYLFVRFFQRPGEETKDDRYWPIPKFQEMLMQLNYLRVLPNESKISPEYFKWWIPVKETIVIDKSKQKSSSDPKPQVNQDSGGQVKVTSPEVFLSYQWGKQTQVMALYQRLTGLGYSCWMDIHQMGGGDSLYDKIDKGVRGCKVVVTCVTPKYSISANCRREVSLADALKKPIIPLLLENMSWPPDGPMSMVFTELLYINCFKDEDLQLKWEGPKFEELLSKIKAFVPDEEQKGAKQSVQESKLKEEKIEKRKSHEVKDMKNQGRTEKEEQHKKEKDSENQSQNQKEASEAKKKDSEIKEELKTPWKVVKEDISKVQKMESDGQLKMSKSCQIL